MRKEPGCVSPGPLRATSRFSIQHIPADDLQVVAAIAKCGGQVILCWRDQRGLTDGTRLIFAVAGSSHFTRGEIDIPSYVPQPSTASSNRRHIPAGRESRDCDFGGLPGVAGAVV